MLKTGFVVAATIGMLAGSAAHAQNFGGHRGPSHGHSHASPRHVSPPIHHRAGHPYAHWRNHPPIVHYHRYGLRPPARGQHWILVGNQHLLVASGTGMVIAFGG